MVLTIQGAVDAFNEELGSDETRLFLQAVNAGLVGVQIDPDIWTSLYGYDHIPLQAYGPVPPSFIRWKDGWFLAALQITSNMVVRLPIGGTYDPIWIRFPDPSTPPPTGKAFHNRAEAFGSFGDRFLVRLVSKTLDQSKRRKWVTAKAKGFSDRRYLRVPIR